MKLVAWAGLIAAVAVTASCGDRAAPGAPPPDATRLALRWTGEFTGEASLPIDFYWCPGRHLGILEAISRDTGLQLVLHDVDSLTLGSRAVIAPDVPSPVLPYAVAGFRFARDTVLGAYNGQSGTVILSRGGPAGTVEGRFTATLRRPGRPDSVMVTGRFPATPVVGRTAGCE